jgi:hypothetical protein
MDSSSALILFSQTTSIESLLHFIISIPGDEEIICLSTHELFFSEKKELGTVIDKSITYYSFADLISDSEMESCDLIANDNIVQRFGTQNQTLQDKYYLEIKKLKNEVIRRNIRKKHSYDKSYILNDDLGIDPKSWMDNTAENCIKNNLFFHGQTSKKNQRIIQRVAKIFNSSIHFVYNGEEKYLFLGSYSRVQQYFSSFTVIRNTNYAMNILLVIFKRLNGIKDQGRYYKHLTNYMMKIILTLFLFYFNKARPIKMVCTIHEYLDIYGILTRALGTQLFCLQDGYLPGNYSSRYLKYQAYVDSYLVWDKLSKDIFIKNNENCKKSSLFSSTLLKYVPARPIEVKNVLIISSGAGDWTALKNRSDEDKLFRVFLEIAKKMPDIKFVFRPHPLWTHHTHQGINSIERISNELVSSNIPNMVISNGAKEESVQYQIDQMISRKSNSIREEIQTADIVFGDHSQTIINAAREGKMIASVNMTNRRSLFDGYNKLGIPCFISANKIIQYLNQLGESTEKIMSYNKAVKRYNEEYS